MPPGARFSQTQGLVGSWQESGSKKLSEYDVDFQLRAGIIFPPFTASLDNSASAWLLPKSHDTPPVKVEL